MFLLKFTGTLFEEVILQMRDESYNKEVGMRILRMRDVRGYSREYVAERADISTRFLYEIEAGKKTFTAKVARDLSYALEINADYLLKGDS